MMYAEVDSLIGTIIIFSWLVESHVRIRKLKNSGKKLPLGVGACSLTAVAVATDAYGDQIWREGGRQSEVKMETHIFLPHKSFSAVQFTFSKMKKNPGNNAFNVFKRRLDR